MLAAADYAEGKSAPPDELRLAFRCQQWNALPSAGGILDQPAGLVERMTVASNVYYAWKAYIERDPKKDKEFAKTDTWQIAMQVIELRKHV